MLTMIFYNFLPLPQPLLPPLYY